MLLTEDEAKTKECRVAGQTGVWATGGGVIPYGGAAHPWPSFPSCAASGCMHWRWGFPEYEYSDGNLVDVLEPGSREPIGQERVPPDGEGWEPNPRGFFATGAHRWYHRVKAQRGFCGLAGHP